MYDDHMRTVLIITIGMALALLFLAIGHRHKYIGTRRATVALIAVWTLAMIVNLVVGVSSGYSFREEFPILIVNVVTVAAGAVIGARIVGRT